MRVMGGIAAIGLGVVLLGFGGLFLLGAAGELHRYVIAALGLGLGGSAIGAGGLLLRRAAAANPARVRRELLALARARDGELTRAEVDAAFVHRMAVADAVLDELCLAGDCEQEAGQAGVTYRFAALQPRVVVRRCGHCGYEAALASDEEGCPRCGATLAVRREAVGSEPMYGMDE